MLPLLITLAVATSQPAPTALDPADRSGLVISTVRHSEWCPAGNVSVDLATGRYLLTLRAPTAVCQAPTLRRQVRRGVLPQVDLGRVRAAAQQLRIEGAMNPDCLHGHRPDYIVVDNGGPHQVVLKTEQVFIWAPDDLTCWSKAASAMQNLLDDVVTPTDGPQ